MKHGWILVVAVTLVGLTAGAAVGQRDVTWSAGAVGGGWYAIATGLADLLRDRAHLAVTVIPGGGAENPILVDSGNAQIGMGLPPLLRAAVRGEDRVARTWSADSRRLLAVIAIALNGFMALFLINVLIAMASLSPCE